MANVNEHDFPPLPQTNATQRDASKTHPSLPHKQGHSVTLNDLPDELILEILEHIPKIQYHDNHQFQTLLNFGCTSHRFYEIITKKVYARFSNTFGEPTLFLRTIISNPRLARFIRDIDIRLEWETDVMPLHTPTAQDKKVIKEGLRELDIPHWKEWATKCYGDVNDNGRLRNITILLFTPNVESIHISDEFEPEAPRPTWVDMISKAAIGAFGNTHGFQQLHSISVQLGPVTLKQIAPLFHMQSLRTLRLEGTLECNWLDDHKQPRYLKQNVQEIRHLIPPACNNVERLFLHDVFYTEDCLEVLVASARRLNAFKYFTSIHAVPIFPPTSKSKTVIGILDRHKASLETIRVSRCSSTDREHPDKSYLREDMKAFKSLKELSCPLSLIMLGPNDEFADRLPSSLETFRTFIRYDADDREYFGGLAHLVLSCQTHVPRLREVRVVTSHYWPKEFKELKEKFTRMCTDAGISFVHEKGDEDTEDEVCGVSSDEEDLFHDYGAHDDGEPENEVDYEDESMDGWSDEVDDFSDKGFYSSRGNHRGFW